MLIKGLSMKEVKMWQRQGSCLPNPFPLGPEYTGGLHFPDASAGKHGHVTEL